MQHKGNSPQYTQHSTCLPQVPNRSRLIDGKICSGFRCQQLRSFGLADYHYRYSGGQQRAGPSHHPSGESTVQDSGLTTCFCRKKNSNHSHHWMQFFPSSSPYIPAILRSLQLYSQYVECSPFGKSGDAAKSLLLQKVIHQTLGSALKKDCEE